MVKKTSSTPQFAESNSPDRMQSGGFGESIWSIPQNIDLLREKEKNNSDASEQALRKKIIHSIRKIRLNPTNQLNPFAILLARLRRLFFAKSLNFKILANLTVALILCLFSACDIVNPEETLPAYLQIDQFDFSTTPAQGEPSEQITDVWVFVDDLSLGIYELPATVPTLAVGNQNITIFPVIRENAIRSTPIIYPLYNRFETTLDLPIGETVTVRPTTSYVSNAVFELVEEFDGNGHALKGSDPNAVQVLDEIGQILLGTEESIEFTSTGTFTDLPTNNGLPVFLEFDYRTNVEFEIGLVGIDPNQINPVNATFYNVVLCPINRWNKVYINLQEVLETSQLPGYKLAFRASTDDTGCGSVTNDPPEVLIDNLKFIRLTN